MPRKRKFRWPLSVAAIFLSVGALPMLANGQGESSGRSATVARDVNGFRLGMHLADATRLAELEYIGGDQVEANAEGFQYTSA
jgi:hypothetical protein